MSLSEETASSKNPEYDLFIKSIGIERKVENRERKRECDDERPGQMGNNHKGSIAQKHFFGLL